MPDISLPFDESAEVATLGSALIDKSAYEAIAGRIKGSDFFLEKHRILWRTLSAIYERGERVDEVSLPAELREHGELEQSGGMEYLIHLLTATPTSANAETYAEIVRRGSIRRQLIDLASRTAQAAHDSPDVFEALRRVEVLYEQIGDWQALRQGRTEFTMSDAVADFSAQMERRYKGEELPGIPTGFRNFDALTGGLPRGELWLLGARPSMGKSALGVNICSNAADSGFKVLIFSMEMSAKQIVNRVEASYTGIQQKTLRSGKLNNEEWGTHMRGAGVIANLPITIDECSDVSPLYMRRAIARHARSGGVDLVFVDYLQLMSSGNGRLDAEERTAAVGVISRALKNIAKDFNVAILAASQLSRNLEARADKRPILSDLRDSGTLEQDAFGVSFLYRECIYSEEADPNIGELITRKNREGAIGMSPLHFDKNLSLFTES